MTKKLKYALFRGASIHRKCLYRRGSILPAVQSQHSYSSSTKTQSASTHLTDPTRRVIFSGIQPTGVPHLGNYMGALSQWAELQASASSTDELYFSIVDLHSLTSTTQTARERRAGTRIALASLLAVGLDPQRSTLFYQSAVPQHAELHWILSASASMGWLARMTQWRTKLGGSDASEQDLAALLSPAHGTDAPAALRLGLFAYPVLQAADILLYGTTHVPVGADQLQHVQFARGAAAAFNHLYGREYGGASNSDEAASQSTSSSTNPNRNIRQILVEPTAVVGAGTSQRIMSLTDPTRKMSKSDSNPASRILLSDSSETIFTKFRTALTDSQSSVTYDAASRPGVTNLCDVIAQLDGSGRRGVDVAREFASMQVQGSVLRVLKERAAQVVDARVAPVRTELLRLLGAASGDALERGVASGRYDTAELDAVAERGREAAARRAEQTMRIVRNAVGLVQ